MISCLLLIDIQNGFVTEKTEHIMPRLESLISSGIFNHIVATQFVNKEGSPYVRSLNWKKLMERPEIDVKYVVKKNTERIFEKNVYSALNDPFLSFVSNKGIERIYIAGIDTDCCVLKTAADMFEKGLNFRVLIDYSTSNGGKKSHEAADTVMVRLIGEGNILRGDMTRERLNE